jgi:RNA polymerase I-specific transcription initiation factor RRN7
VSVKGFPPELETVVRDLWDLRTRGLRMRDGRSGYGSGTETMMMFSSQGEGDTGNDTDATDGRSLTSRRSRTRVVSVDKLPRLTETLGLCYLGILLLRLPTSLGEIYKWVTRDEMVYTRAVSHPYLKLNVCLLNPPKDKRSPKGDAGEVTSSLPCCS